MADLIPDWYVKKRQMLQDAFELPDIKIKAKYAMMETRSAYTICTVPFEFNENNWWYTKFTAFSEADPSKKIEFIRNYGNFPHVWVSKHPKRRKYLVCAEDTESVTVVDLSGMKYHTWVFDDGFWSRSFHVSPDHKTIAIYGSRFGELETIKFFDFNNPINFPWPSIGEFSGSFVGDDIVKYPTHIIGWEPDSSALRVISETLHEDSDTMTVDEYSIYIDGTYQFLKQEMVE